MTRVLLALAAALWLASCGGPERAWSEPSPALWEVSGPNGERGWLFGTIHALPDGAEWRTPEVDAAVAGSDLLVVEVAELGDSERATESFEERARTGGLPPLSQRVAAEDRPALAALMERAGRDDADFADTESWAAGLLLASAVREGDPANGVDRALLAEGKPVAGLESFAAQYARFDGLSERDQADLLAGIAREAQSGRSDARVEAWLTGDVEALERDALGGILAYPRLREALLDARNREWAGRIDALLRDGRKPLVGVGAAHMLGDGGLPALLAARGYTVRRIQ